MTTKTLTITEDAYNLLTGQKLVNESFSEEITRLMSKKRKSVEDFFGIITNEQGTGMLKDLEKIKKANIRMIK